MILREALHAAWMGITSNILRTSLTTLGIVIGVAAVITLIGVGQGAEEDIMQEMDQLGTNMIMITPSPQNGYSLSTEDSDELLERVPALQRTSPALNTGATVHWGTEEFEASVEGVGASYPHITNSQLQAGRFFDEDDVGNAARLAVIGQTVVDNLFSERNPMGETIQVHGQSYTVIGTLEPVGAGPGGQDQDDAILVPITSLQRTIGVDDVSIIYAQGTNTEDVDLATAHLERIFTAKTGREDAVQIASQTQIMDMLSAVTGTLTIMLGSIAGISLIVGGIGIMNIMLVSVKERTREIGIRKAVGARKRDILMQFLIESIALSIGGGILGIMVGLALASVISQLGLNVAITAGSIALACGFSAGVGLLSGVYPAMQAASLDPIESLRYE